MKKIFFIIGMSSFCFTEFRMGIDVMKDLHITKRYKMNKNIVLGYESFLKDKTGIGLELVMPTEVDSIRSLEFGIISLYGMYKLSSKDNIEAFFKFGLSHVRQNHDPDTIDYLSWEYDFLDQYSSENGILKVKNSPMIGFGANFNKKYQISYTLHTSSIEIGYKSSNYIYSEVYSWSISRFSLSMLF